MIDTSKPVPGPYRMPDENERRCRLHLVHPFRDCTTVCELNPDLEEYTDATMRLLVASWDMRELLLAAQGTDTAIPIMTTEFFRRTKAILTFIEKGAP